MPDLLRISDLRFEANAGEGYGQIHNDDGDSIVVSPAEALELGTALTVWAKTAGDHGE